MNNIGFEIYSDKLFALNADNAIDGQKLADLLQEAKADKEISDYETIRLNT